MNYSAILFDMDGTLVDSEATHHRALLDVLSTHGITLPTGFDEATTGQSLEVVHQRLVDSAGLSLSCAQLADEKHAAFVARRDELAWRAGAQEAIAAISGQGLVFAVVSNSDRILVDLGMDAIGLAGPTLTTVSRNDVSLGKPNAEPYLRAASLLGVDPARCIVVEDSAVGAAAGLAAGMTVVGWPEPQRTDMRFPAGTQVYTGAALAAFLLQLIHSPRGH